jgi:integrase
VTTSTFTPFVFLRRGRTWTIVFPGPNGAKKQKALPFRGDSPSEDVRKAQRAKAEKALALFIEKRKSAVLIEGDAASGPMTVARWATLWLRTREVKGISSVDDYRSRLEHHVLPHIGAMRIDDVTAEHVMEIMRLVAKAGLAPRTQRHVYQVMQAMFNKAVPRLLVVSPCSIDSEDLPSKTDADPEWRPTALFERSEVAELITNTLIPEDRRVLYAVMFLTGMRIGEISALHFRHYIPTMEPLGQLRVGRSYNSKKRKVKGTKTDRPRLIPVHPWLAQILERWRAVGWEKMMGRPPGHDDILIPSRTGARRNASTAWKQLNGGTSRGGGRKAPTQGDLQRLGFRPRRQHDARRTFITYARADGARKDLLRLITHGAEGDIVDIYTEMPWAPLCEEVAKLRMSPPPPAPLASVPTDDTLLPVAGLPTGCHVPETPMNQEVTMRPQRDSNPGVVHGRTAPGDAKAGLTAPSLGHPGTKRPPGEAEGGRSGPSATLATLALRQALAALDRGRIDQAKEILLRAIQDEAEQAEVVS